MKKLKLITTVCGSILIAACTDMYGPSYYNYNYNQMHDPYQHGNMQIEPLEHGESKPKGSKPRPYSVTPQDQMKYENLNNRIQNRLKKVKGASTSSTTSELKETRDESKQTTMKQPVANSETTTTATETNK